MLLMYFLNFHLLLLAYKFQFHPFLASSNQLQLNLEELVHVYKSGNVAFGTLNYNDDSKLLIGNFGTSKPDEGAEIQLMGGAHTTPFSSINLDNYKGAFRVMKTDNQFGSSNPSTTAVLFQLLSTGEAIIPSLSNNSGQLVAAW